MHRLARRTLLKTTGAAVVLGLGTAGAQTQGTAQQSGGSFTATATDGFITINADRADNSDKRLQLAGSDVDGEFIIEGEISSDGTWESTNTTLPSFSESESSFLGEITVDVDYLIDGSVTGEIDRNGNLMTGTLPLRIDISVDTPIADNPSATLTVNSEDLTTGKSGSMNGSATGLDTASGTATLVDNKLTIPGTGESFIDDFFNVPSQTSGRNWLELQFDLDLPGSAASPGTFSGTVTDSDGNPLSGATVEFVKNGTTVTTATTDSNGAYSVEVPSGNYEITAIAPNYQAETETRAITEGVTKTVDFSLLADSETPGTIEGRVFDILGNPLSNVEVRVIDAGSVVTSTSAGAAGGYTVTVLPGEYSVVAENSGQAARQSVTVTAGQTTTADLNLSPLPRLTSNPVADPNGDGLYEDIRGDGSVNVLDVQTLFNNLDDVTLQSNAEKFDFSGTGGDVTVIDVQALFNMIQQ
jgi:hypothetical protein